MSKYEEAKEDLEMSMTEFYSTCQETKVDFADEIRRIASDVSDGRVEL